MYDTLLFAIIIKKRVNFDNFYYNFIIEKREYDYYLVHYASFSNDKLTQFEFNYLVGACLTYGY